MRYLPLPKLLPQSSQLSFKPHHEMILALSVSSASKLVRFHINKEVRV